MSQKQSLRQTRLATALPMVGNSVNEQGDSVLSKIDVELSKLFEDRNIQLADGGIITFPTAGTSVTFTQALKLHINSRVAGGSPQIVDLASTTRTLSADGRMIYAVVNRTAGTATVTDDAATLPAQTSANQEIVLIAKRSDSADGTKRVYFRDGFTLSAGQASRLGQTNFMYTAEMAVIDKTDPTKQLKFDNSTATTATSTTIKSAQTANRVVTMPDATTTLVGQDTIDSLTNKQISYSSANDAASTGSNATLAAIASGVVRLTNSSLVSISGIPTGASGKFLVLENKTGNQITVNNEETTATAANRIQTGAGGNISMPNNSSFMFIYDSTTSRWQLAGGSGSGSGSGGNKNYLSAITTSQSTTPNTGNGNFEAGSTTGWSLKHANMTGVLPTGAPTGSANGNLNIGIISSGQLSGTYSGSMSNSVGSTTTGDMIISDQFNIDSSDKAKVLQVKFNYSVIAGASILNLSGTSSNSHAIYIYDVDNAAWIQPAGVYNLTQNSGIGSATATFQTSSNGTKYQLAIVNINSVPGAFTLYLDDLSVGPHTYSSGPAVTDWVNWTPTGTWTSNTTYTGRYRRVGDTAEFDVSISLSGAPTAVGLAVNLPSGMTMDSTKLGFGSVNQILGIGKVIQTNEYVIPSIRWSSSTSIDVRYALQNGATDVIDLAVSNTGPVTFASGAVISLKWSAPIVGWSSNTQMSNDTDTRVIAMSSNGAPSGTISTNATTQPIIFPAPSVDTAGSYNSSTGLYTVPVSGQYEIDCMVDITAVTSVSALQLQIMVNGSIAAGVTAPTQAAATRMHGQTGAIITMSAGQTLGVSISNVSAVGTLSYQAGCGNISIRRLTGPSIIAATETVAAEYASSAGNTIAHNAAVYIDFGTKQGDTHNAVLNAGSGNTTTAANGWKYVVPVSGRYMVAACVLGIPTASQANSMYAAITKNAADVMTGNQTQYTATALGATSARIPGFISGIVQAVAGDTIQVYVLQTNGTSSVMSTNGSPQNNRVTIVRVGN